MRDYEFIQYLSLNLEDLLIMADTMGPGIKFVCSWLLKYRHLNSLWLGKKAKKNLEVISQLPELKSLALSGIKVNDFSFLYQMDLERFALLWNSNNDLQDLKHITVPPDLSMHMNLQNNISNKYRYRSKIAS